MARSIILLVPELQGKVVDLVEQCINIGHPIIITQTRRTSEEQAELYARGRTKPGAIVTYAPPGTSRHELGEAFDFCFAAPEPYAESHPWDQVGELGEKLGLVWGGRWRHPDRCHFELPHVAAPPRTLRRGDRGVDVLKVGLQLMRLRLLQVASSHFDDATEAAVRAFQAGAGLEPDGVVGFLTRNALISAENAQKGGKG